MTGLKDKHVYKWTVCSYCGQPLPKGTPRPYCDDCAEKMTKPHFDKKREAEEFRVSIDVKGDKK
jgi:predicted amidophosphoribosyltransferase